MGSILLASSRHFRFITTHHRNNVPFLTADCHNVHASATIWQPLETHTYSGCAGPRKVRREKIRNSIYCTKPIAFSAPGLQLYGARAGSASGVVSACRVLCQQTRRKIQWHRMTSDMQLTVDARCVCPSKNVIDPYDGVCSARLFVLLPLFPKSPKYYYDNETSQKARTICHEQLANVSR